MLLRTHSEGLAPIHCAIRNGVDVENEKRLIDFIVAQTKEGSGGALPSTAYGDLCLHVAASCNNREAILSLLEAGENISATNRSNLTAVDIARANGYMDLQPLLRLEPPAPYEINSIFRSCEEDNLGLLSWVLPVGRMARLNETRDAAGRTMLMVASSAGSLGIIEHLVRAGAWLDATDSRGFSAMHFAAEAGADQAMKLLTRLGANILLPAGATSGMTPVHVACSSNHVDCVKTMLEVIPHKSTEILASRTHFGDTPLQIFCQIGSVEGVNLVLRSHGDVNVQDRNGVTPLMVPF